MPAKALQVIMDYSEHEIIKKGAALRKDPIATYMREIALQTAEKELKEAGLWDYENNKPL